MKLFQPIQPAQIPPLPLDIQHKTELKLPAHVTGSIRHVWKTLDIHLVFRYRRRGR